MRNKTPVVMYIPAGCSNCIDNSNSLLVQPELYAQFLVG